MPVPLLIALILAFEAESSGRIAADVDAISLLPMMAIGIFTVAFLALGVGAWIARQVGVYGYMTTGTRLLYSAWSRLIVPFSSGIYGWILFGLGWGRMVESTWDLGGWFLLDHLLVFAPFLLMQVVIWCGLFLVERALRTQIDPEADLRIDRYLVLKGRAALGLIFPVAMIFVLRRDVIARVWPDWAANPISEPVDLAILGCVVLGLSPIFVRLAFPTRPLVDGPLRRRLEHLSRRVGFRYRDILVWDTAGGMVNACVTGVFPGFRYVLLTDALLEDLEPSEVCAVFGHEVGHVVHRHLPFFGLFFLGSLGILTLASAGASGLQGWTGDWWASPGFLDSSGSNIIETGLALAAAVAFFGLSFGHISRRFERQADVFGCKSVSCGRAECPTHADPDEPGEPDGGPLALAAPCFEGVRIFTEALARVARQNGLRIHARSWRHGSIASRILFLETLKDDPSRERRFQRDIGRLRRIWTVLLTSAIVLAIVAEAFASVP